MTKNGFIHSRIQKGMRHEAAEILTEVRLLFYHGKLCGERRDLTGDDKKAKLVGGEERDTGAFHLKWTSMDPGLLQGSTLCSGETIAEALSSGATCELYNR